MSTTSNPSKQFSQGDLVRIERYRDGMKKRGTIIDSGLVVGVGDKFIKVWDAKGVYRVGPEDAESFPIESKMMRVTKTGSFREDNQ